MVEQDEIAPALFFSLQHASSNLWRRERINIRQCYG